MVFIVSVVVYLGKNEKNKVWDLIFFLEVCEGFSGDPLFFLASDFSHRLLY